METIRLETDARGVTTLTLARPDKHNALSARMIAELTEAAARIAADRETRVVVLTGQGKSFCAGGDLAWMRAQFDATREQRIAEAAKLARMLKALNELPQPMIARVNGQAFGGGLGMMSVADVAIGADDAKFGLTEVRLGLIPATISPYVVARISEAESRRIFMSGALFDAAEAERIGLLARAVPPEALDTAVEAETRPYLGVAPGAVARSKALVRSLVPPVDEAVIADTAARLADCWEDEEAREGVGAFFERRKPRWA